MYIVIYRRFTFQDIPKPFYMVYGQQYLWASLVNTTNSSAFLEVICTYI